ncbi:uncharacterized protein LOC134210407 [Armigeres subalbatus]|uniref:uncharacterized protein LOC134210407 n=1 Tax=Armigeres subalbatus TaxID=124917 RepID=UPI002ED1AB72
MIIPENHHFTNIIIETLHREQLHVGQNGLLAKIREQFWPVNAKRTINRVLRKCVRCFRVNPKDVQQFMGDLPSARVTIAPPFERTGVDYAGPFLIKQGRSKAPTKAYVCLFVCMCTKAIHLELVNSMTTEGFLGALQRFVGRRGNVSDIYSDNGSNFIGAKRELQEFLHLLKSQILEEKVATFCQPRGINWHFMPPRAPHQGGLWEAGVKAMKTHMYRTLKEAYLTYEEMCTLLVQIEAILNSRPLVEQSNNPTDFRALSPGHFLVGRELIAEPSYIDLKQHTLTRYQLIQQRKESFWRRWSREYITGLQKRGKWYKGSEPLRVGLVLLKEENVPPQTWKLGRIVEVHPGKDGVIRVVAVRTKSGVYLRPTTQVAILPIRDEDE